MDTVFKVLSPQGGIADVLYDEDLAKTLASKITGFFVEEYSFEGQAGFVVDSYLHNLIHGE